MKDRDFALKVITRFPLAFAALDENHRNDKEIAMIAVGFDSEQFEHVGSSLQDDKDLIRKSITRQRADALQFASLELRNDVPFMKELLNKNPYCIEFCGNNITSDRKIALTIAERGNNLLQYFAPCLQDDDEVVKLAIKGDFSSIFFASKRLRSDFDMGMHAVKEDGRALLYISSDLRDNEEIIKAASAQNPQAINLASERVRNSIDATYRPDYGTSEYCTYHPTGLLTILD